MRRAAVRVFRTTSQYTGRRAFSRGGRRAFFAQNFQPPHPHGSAPARSLTNGGGGGGAGGSGAGVSKGASSPAAAAADGSSSSTYYYSNNRSHPYHTLAPPLRSSMYIRRFSVALVSTIVGYGAWYSYKTSGGEYGSYGLGRGYSTTGSAAATAAGADAAQQMARPVLVIGADELFTGTFVGEGPISKETDDEGRKVVEILTPDQATRTLRKSEQSFFVNRGQGVVRYDMVQLPSNNPIEDDHAEKIIELPNKPSSDDGATNGDWMFWGVYDGHSGWPTSAKLRQTLISVVARELNDTYKATPAASPSGEAIDAAIKRGFIRLDDEIVHRSVEKVFKLNSKTAAAELLAPALSGSCALLSFYDSRTKLLRVACTGDSRAVLGRRASSGKWSATALSVDQTGATPEEEARLRAEHPGEADVVRAGRVLGGLQPTRAFGDASYKWSREVSERLKRSFFGRTPSPKLKTPPYVTAEPVVTTTRIEPDKGDFLVLATDGLWEMLTNEEVVGLVGKWLEESQSQAAPAKPGAANSQFDAAWSKIFGSPKALPVEPGKGAKGEEPPIRLQQWGMPADEKNRFVVKDKNVATHLIRNALGGRNEEQVCALLTLPAPYSRRYRDDLTVQVIFFGNGEKTGAVNVNQEATAQTKPAVKAKL